MWYNDSNVFTRRSVNDSSRIFVNLFLHVFPIFHFMQWHELNVGLLADGSFILGLTAFLSIPFYKTG